MADTFYPDLIYTKVDEAPELASASLLPIIECFGRAAGLTIGRRDISLAGRIIAAFPDYLTDAQRQSDDLAALAEWVKTPKANVVKLPNISASIPQLVACINELQSQGYHLPDYPILPKTDEERAVAARYDAIKGSAVNPVLRVKVILTGAVRKRLKIMLRITPIQWGFGTSGSKTHVSAMLSGDFISNEKSATLTATQAGTARIEFEDENGDITILKDGLNLEAGTIVDASFMCVRKLRAFLREQLAEAKQMGILFSVHLKATMMKVSDPIIFGNVVAIFLEDFAEKHGAVLDELGVNYRLGLSDLEALIATLPEATRTSRLEASLIACFCAKSTPLHGQRRQRFEQSPRLI